MRSTKSALQGGSVPEAINHNMNIQNKTWKLLTLQQRRSAIYLLGLMVIGMVLETVGVGLVVPAIALITQSDITDKYPEMQLLANSIGNPTHEWLVVYGMLALVGVYAVKSLFLVFLTWVQMKFVFGVHSELSRKLFSKYLKQSYSFHLQRNSAQLIRNVLSETHIFTHTGLRSAMILFTEVLVLLGVLVLLVFIEPLGTLIIVISLGLAGGLFHVYTRGYILRWGEERQFREGLRMQYLQEGLGGVKEVKLLGREDNFVSQYEVHNVRSAHIGRYKSILQLLPRIWLELLAVIGLAILVLVIIWQGKSLELVVPTLGVFAAAAFRLIPSINRVISAIQGIRFSVPATETLFRENANIDSIKVVSNAPVFSFKHIINLDGINYRYPDTTGMSLSNLTMAITRGTSVGFIGGSGAGKSTLVDVILGLLTPGSGSIKVDGIDIQTNMRGWQNLIGYVPQSIYLTDESLRRNIAFGLPNEMIDEDAITRTIQAAQLDDFVKKLPEGLDTMVGERGVRLSGGQLQRIGIARALYHDPQILVLDEATSSLDMDTERDVMNAVNALHGDKTIIIVAHRLTTVAHCDTLFRIENGSVIEEGSPRELLIADNIDNEIVR